RGHGEHEELRRRAARIQESRGSGAAASGHSLPSGECLLVAEYVGRRDGAVSRGTRERSFELHGAMEDWEHYSRTARGPGGGARGSTESAGCVPGPDGGARGSRSRVDQTGAARRSGEGFGGGSKSRSRGIFDAFPFGTGISRA